MPLPEPLNAEIIYPYGVYVKSKEPVTKSFGCHLSCHCYICSISICWALTTFYC